MKKLILIFAIALASCTPDEKNETNECNCNAVTFVNNVPNGETYPYSEDCNDIDKLLFEFEEPGYITKRIVKCD